MTDGRVRSARALRRGTGLLLAAALLLAGCSDPGGGSSGTADPSTPTSSPTAPAHEPPPEATASPRPTPAPLALDHLDIGMATTAVAHLAGTIGPRMATGPRFRRARQWVARQLRGSGYEVRREEFDVPGGTSWGVPVSAGRSSNLVATPPGFDRTDSHLLVGAHLDTVPQAPGAEDNASGVGALLAVARAAAGRTTRLPVVFVVFGAEEPRGPGDDDHHYGSRHHVAELTRAERRALRGMVALDRVGVGDTLPVCSAGEPDRVRAQLLRAARDAGVAAVGCQDNRTSDHWSFVRNGLPGARLGSTPYAGYHSAGDVPSVVNRAQLRRAALTTISWLRPR